MKYKLVIFDLDGTLVDSIHGITHAMNAVLAEHGFPIHHIDLYKRFVGNGQNVLVQKSLPDGNYSDEMLNSYLSDYVRAYKQLWNYKMSVYDGINSLLEYLDCKSVIVNVNTNKNERSTLQILQQYFPDVTFTSVIAGDTLNTRKPHPEGAISIADIAGVSIGECVYIGDSEVDIETARNAGMDCISVGWGFRTKDELIAAGATYYVDHPDEIQRFI
jgi:phosphoglycolate phosphatase